MIEMSHTDLDAAVSSLYAVGGVYEIVAKSVEHDNRPHCTGEPTGEPLPWAGTEAQCQCMEPNQHLLLTQPCPTHGWSKP